MSDSVPHPVTSVQHSCLHHNDTSPGLLSQPSLSHCTSHEIGLPCVNKNIWTFNGSHPIIQSRILAKPNSTLHLWCPTTIVPRNETKPEAAKQRSKILQRFPGRIVRSAPFPLNPPDDLKMQIMRGVGVDNKFQ